MMDVVVYFGGEENGKRKETVVLDKSGYYSHLKTPYLLATFCSNS